MAVLLDQNTRLIVQGLTGREGTFHAAAAAAYCAAGQAQDAFWHLHEGMFAAQARLADSVVHRLMREGDWLSGAHLMVDATRQDKLYRRLKATPAVAGIAISAAALASFRAIMAQ